MIHTLNGVDIDLPPTGSLPYDALLLVHIYRDDMIVYFSNIMTA